MNLLARLVKVAAPGGLVVTEAVAADLAPDAWSLQPLDPADLRGIEGPVRAFAVEPKNGHPTTPQMPPAAIG